MQDEVNDITNEFGRLLSSGDHDALLQLYNDKKDVMDINRCWHRVISKNGPPSVLHSMMKDNWQVMNYWDGEEMWTPVKSAMLYESAVMLACAERVLHEAGSGQWAGSAAAQKAQRAASKQAVARDTVLRLCRQAASGGLFGAAMAMMEAVLLEQIAECAQFDDGLFALVMCWRPRVADALLDSASRCLKKGQQTAWAHWALLDADLAALMSSHRRMAVVQQCKTATDDAAQELKSDMGDWKAMDEPAYLAICKLKSTDEKAHRHEWRQDGCFVGEGMNAVAVAATDPDVMHLSLALGRDLALEFDLTAYLSWLLFVGLLLDEPFQRWHQEHTPTGARYRLAPVKLAARCRDKALELEAVTAPHPRCATLIDLIRCSFTFDTPADMLAGIEQYRASVKESGSGKLELEEVRIKNGFAMFAESGGVPNEYCDVKLNVAVRSSQTLASRKLALIAEVQFLCAPMIKAKKVGHAVYKVERAYKAGGAMHEGSQWFQAHAACADLSLRRVQDHKQLGRFVMLHRAQVACDEELKKKVIKKATTNSSFSVDHFAHLLDDLTQFDDTRKRTLLQEQVFHPSFMYIFIRTRSRDPALPDWIDYFRDHCDTGKFDYMLRFKSRGGLCPLTVYVIYSISCDLADCVCFVCSVT